MVSTIAIVIVLLTESLAMTMIVNMEQQLLLPAEQFNGDAF